MLYHSCQDIRWERHDLRSYHPCFNNMERMPYASYKDFCVKVVISKDLNNLFYKFYAVLPNVVQPSDKRTNIRCTCLRSQNCLIGRENKRHVCRDTLLSQLSYSSETIRHHGNFHNDVLAILH